jgi:hypothetical protein
MPKDLLCGRVADLSVDTAALASYYRQVVEPGAATQYHDNEAAYEGWALTSRDGSTTDGVKRIDRKATQQANDKRRGIVPTPLFQGYIVKVIDDLISLGFAPHRIRIMRLAHEGFAMKWHRDADMETWRLHIPIITSDHSFFEWKLGEGDERQVHLSAGGSGWLVRVDELHRAVNLNPSGGFRVHLLMSLSGVPRPELFADPIIEKAKNTAVRQ